MKLLIDHLRTYCSALPEETLPLRRLMDDVGLEVKRVDATPYGPAFTLEFLANRGDHHSYLGVAREIAGRLGAPLTLPPSAVISLGSPPVLISVDSPLCLRYSATLLELPTRDGDLPSFARPILETAECFTGDAVVDITNLVNLEIGQPLHAFDADTIVGTVRARLARADEPATLLGETKPRILSEGTLVIADNVKVLAVAGVIGCDESKVTAGTRRIVLESALFDPVAVRKAARALATQTDAAARFERGGEADAVRRGVERAVYLLESVLGARRVGNTWMGGNWQLERTVEVDVAQMSRFLGMQITTADAQMRLERYGFAVQKADGGLLVTVPSHRIWDVVNLEDIHEEVARSIGYNAIPSVLPAVAMGATPAPDEQMRTAVSEVLVGAGFYEVITPGFYGRDMRDKLGLEAEQPLWTHVETLNAQDAAFSLLKNNCLAQTCELVAYSLRYLHDKARAFEWTRIFVPDASAQNGVCREQDMLWVVANVPQGGTAGWKEAPEGSLWHLKGLLENIARRLRLSLTLDTATAGEGLAKLLHPYRQANVLLEGRCIGVLGEVRPDLSAAFGIKGVRLNYLELMADALVLRQRPTQDVPPTFQPSVRSLAFTLPPRFEAQRVAACLMDTAQGWLERVNMIDVYEHVEDEVPVRTVTYELSFARHVAQHTTEEKNAQLFRLAHVMENTFGADGVKLRR